MESSRLGKGEEVQRGDFERGRRTAGEGWWHARKDFWITGKDHYQG